MDKERSSLFVIDNSHTSDLIVPINNVTVFCGKAYNRPVPLEDRNIASLFFTPHSVAHGVACCENLVLQQRGLSRV